MTFLFPVLDIRGIGVIKLFMLDVLLALSSKT